MGVKIVFVTCPPILIAKFPFFVKCSRFIYDWSDWSIDQFQMSVYLLIGMFIGKRRKYRFSSKHRWSNEAVDCSFDIFACQTLSFEVNLCLLHFFREGIHAIRIQWNYRWFCRSLWKIKSINVHKWRHRFDTML